MSSDGATKATLTHGFKKNDSLHRCQFLSHVDDFDYERSPADDPRLCEIPILGFISSRWIPKLLVGSIPPSTGLHTKKINNNNSTSLSIHNISRFAVE